MTHEEIIEKIREVLSETLDLDDLEMTESTTAQDVEGWDSVAHVQIMVAIESAFGIRFRTGDMTGLKNVGELAQRIAQRLDAA